MRSLPRQYAGNTILAAMAFTLVVWTAFPFLWILLTSLKNPGDIISCGAPPGAMSRETKAGHHITLVIDQVGEMEFDVVAE